MFRYLALLMSRSSSRLCQNFHPIFSSHWLSDDKSSSPFPNAVCPWRDCYTVFGWSWLMTACFSHSCAIFFGVVEFAYVRDSWRDCFIDTRQREFEKCEQPYVSLVLSNVSAKFFGGNVIFFYVVTYQPCSQISFVRSMDIWDFQQQHLSDGIYFRRWKLWKSDWLWKNDTHLSTSISIFDCGVSVSACVLSFLLASI